GGGGRLVGVDDLRRGHHRVGTGLARHGDAVLGLGAHDPQDAHAVSLMPSGEHYVVPGGTGPLANGVSLGKGGTSSPLSPPCPRTDRNHPPWGARSACWSQVLAGVGDRVDGPARLGALLAGHKGPDV